MRFFIVLSLLILVFGCTGKEPMENNEAQVTLNETNQLTPPVETQQLEKPPEVKESNVNEIEIEAPTPEEIKETPKIDPNLVNGKTSEERLQEAYDRLHTMGSGKHARESFPDLELVYTDSAKGTNFPSMILPFRYYYSEELNKTFNICNIELTVFICKGKLDRLITKEDKNSERCEVTQIYQDPRLGESGGYNYDYSSYYK